MLKGLVMYVGFRGKVKEKGPVYTWYGEKKKRKMLVGCRFESKAAPCVGSGTAIHNSYVKDTTWEDMAGAILTICIIALSPQKISVYFQH